MAKWVLKNEYLFEVIQCYQMDLKFVLSSFSGNLSKC
jgi:hypothetical protein